MLRNGVWVEGSSLNVGSSLMPVPEFNYKVLHKALDFWEPLPRQANAVVQDEESWL